MEQGKEVSVCQTKSDVIATRIANFDMGGWSLADIPNMLSLYQPFQFSLKIDMFGNAVGF